jgi:hypothetical protein
VAVQSGSAKATPIKEIISASLKDLSMTITMLRRRHTMLWSRVEGKPQCSKCPLLDEGGSSSEVEREEELLPYKAKG